MTAPHSGRDHVWFLSPAAVTAAFVVVKLAVSVVVSSESSELMVSATEGRLEATKDVRVVADIIAADRQIETARPVPETEAALLELFAHEEAVVFTSDEVEVVETDSKVFDELEVRVERPRVSAE